MIAQTALQKFLEQKFQMCFDNQEREKNTSINPTLVITTSECKTLFHKLDGQQQLCFGFSDMTKEQHIRACNYWGYFGTECIIKMKLDKAGEGPPVENGEAAL